MKMGIAIHTGGPLAVGGEQDIFLSLEEARKLWEQLGGLFGGTSEEIGFIDARLAYLEMRNSKAEAQEERLTGAPVKEGDTGRTVWATDGAGNPISPDELKTRNRERNDKWAEVGKKFAAGANQSDRPDYYCKSRGGPWEPFLATFEYEPRWLSRRDSRHVRMGPAIVHALSWGDPTVTGFNGSYRMWDCVNGVADAQSS